MVRVTRGTGPLVLAVSHTGTHLPEAIWDDLNETGRALADTDWRIEALHDGLAPDATVVRTCVHRYVVDANRDPSGASLYPGRATTGLVPLTDFDGRPLRREGREPDAAEVERRREVFHAPYHAALSAEIERVRAAHGAAILWDCHSIRSRVPRLFEAVLPELNLGTDDGASGATPVEAAAMRAVERAPCTHVLDGRLQGGRTTRHHGRPRSGVHAVQMEIAQRAYPSEEAPPWALDAALAGRLRPHLAAALAALAALAP